MGIGSLLHTIKAVGHICVGDVPGAVVEGGKALTSLVVGSAIKEVANETGVTDWIEDLFS